MESAVWILDILMEFHEKSDLVGESSHQRSFVGISVNLWSMCIQRLRLTSDLNQNSGH